MAELHRTLISQPMSLTPYPEHKCPKPVNASGERIQVTAYFDELSRAVERWQFNEDDVRWYHVEKVVNKRISVTVERTVPMG